VFCAVIASVSAEMMINRSSWVVVLTLSYCLQKACFIVFFFTGLLLEVFYQ